MRRTGIILFASCLGGIFGVYAQDRPVIPMTKADSIIQQIYIPAPMQIPADWLKGVENTLFEEKRKISNIMQERATQSIIQRPQGSVKVTVNNALGTWKMNIGNFSIETWSPYLDRALDARTLSLPVPRNMRPDKRPESVRRMDKLKR